MNIKLNRLIIENIKGVKSFEVELEGDNAVIKAENGVGKTTVYDAFLWLLFGKNSEGKKDFEVRPLDKDNQPIKGLVVATEAEIDCDGTVHTFRKEQHEKVVKKQLRGYETLCWIDEVPKKVNEYSDYIGELIAEDTFKLLTNLRYFPENEKRGGIHWTKRRAMLLAIAGEIGTPEGFDELLAALNSRTVDEYKEVLAGQKKRLTKERDEINPRIDEIQRGLDEYAGTDTKGIAEERDEIKVEIVKLDEQRQKLFETEKQRQEQIEKVNKLQADKAKRATALANDTTGIKTLLDEKKDLEVAVAAKQQIVTQVKNDRKTQQTNLTALESQLDTHLIKLNAIRDAYKTTSENPVTDTCSFCGQSLPENKLAEFEEKRKNQLITITKNGNDIMADVETCKKTIADYEAKIKELEESLKQAETDLLTAQGTKVKRFAEIDKQIASNETTQPENDPLWRAICFDIKKLEEQIGGPVSEQLQAIDNQRTEKLHDVAQLDKALAQADRRSKDKARITELEQKEKQLAQQIADVEKQLADIDEYKATESRMIESAVNGKFKHVEFKLFNQLLNGGLEECCEATFNGVPYADMSTGQQILCGIDIVNILSAHYGVAVPLFIDHSESLTIPIEAETQTIKLFAQSETKELIVEREGVVQEAI